VEKGNVFYFPHFLKMEYSYSFSEHKNFLSGILSCDSHTLGTIYVKAVQEVVGLCAQLPFKNHGVTAW
jgi:hypothetical protein